MVLTTGTTVLTCRNPVWVLAFFSVLTIPELGMVVQKSRNPVWVLAFFSVEDNWLANYEDSHVAIQYESWLSFQFREAGGGPLLGWWCRNPVWVLAFFSVKEKKMAVKIKCTVAIQYESWLSFQYGKNCWNNVRQNKVAIQYESWLSFQSWKSRISRDWNLTSQSSMSPGFLFSFKEKDMVKIKCSGSQSSMSPGFLFRDVSGIGG